MRLKNDFNETRNRGFKEQMMLKYRDFLRTMWLVWSITVIQGIQFQGVQVDCKLISTRDLIFVTSRDLRPLWVNILHVCFNTKWRRSTRPWAMYSRTRWCQCLRQRIEITHPNIHFRRLNNLKLKETTQIFRAVRANFEHGECGRHIQIHTIIQQCLLVLCKNTFWNQSNHTKTSTRYHLLILVWYL